MPTDESLHEIRVQLWNQLYTHFFAEEFLDTAWWILLISLIVAYVIWWLLADKSRLRDLLLFGSFVAVSVAFLEAAGTTMALWQYSERLLPVLALPFPFDYTIAPILMMLAFQYTRTWSQYIPAAAVAAAFYSFVLLPLAQFLHIIELFRWNFAYHFIYLMGVAVVSRYVMLAVMASEAAARHHALAAANRSPLPQPAAKPLPDDENQKRDGS